MNPKQLIDYAKCKAVCTSNKLAKSQKGSELVEKIIMVAFSVAASILVGAYISYVIRSIGESSQTVTKTSSNPL
jgi:hypothetical protein